LSGKNPDLRFYNHAIGREKYFAADLKAARRRYLSYVSTGLDQGRRPELIGGGLIRSLGGWTEVKKKRRLGMERIKGDQRILGDTAFVQTMLKQAKEKYERGYELRAQGVDLDYIAEKAAGLYDIEPDEIFSKGRQQHRADARGLFCYWATRELNVSLNALARKLMMTPSGIGYAVARGESIVRNYGYRLAK